ncbi:hypothetical protein BLD25_04330 [Candidatus Gracilibacteria bacterium GN02-872]|nr:hypothetical protein BLD25_04330 [Candidatus Gracilibacteria bacterium GN02-872]
MTEENLTYEQTLDRTSRKLIRLAKIGKINVSHISNAIQYILDISKSKGGLTEEELIKEIDSFIDKIECRK